MMIRNQVPGAGLFVDLGVMVSPKATRDDASPIVCREFFLRASDGELRANVRCFWFPIEDWNIVADRFPTWETMRTPDGMVAMCFA